MRHSILLTLGFATLAAVAAAGPSTAARWHVGFGQAVPAPAWTFGIEYGKWANASDPAYYYPPAEPPGRLIVRYPHDDAVVEVSVMRMWRPIIARASLSRAEIDFGVVDTVAGAIPPLGTATCDQLRLSALFPVWSVWRLDDCRPGGAHWALGVFTGPTVGWTRLSDARASDPGARYAGLDRLSVGSSLQAGWEFWLGAPLWYDGPLAHVLLYIDMAVVGFGKDLLEYQTTPASPFISGGSRVSPATFKVGLAYSQRPESVKP